MNLKQRIAKMVIDDYEQCKRAYDNILVIEGRGMFSFIVRQSIAKIRSRVHRQLEAYRALVVDKMSQCHSAEHGRRQ